jgi:fibronectin-binding autotransporter adhesin
MDYARRQDRPFRVFATFVLAMVVLSLACAPSALAQCTDSWTGGNGNWSDGANWSNGMEPGSSDNVCIKKSGAAVNMDVSDGIANLTVGSGNSLTLPNVTQTNNNLVIGGSSIINSGQIILPGGGSNQGGPDLNISSGGAVTLSGGGSIIMNSSAQDAISGFGAGGTLLNQETIEGAGNIANDLTLNNDKGGVINANQSGTQLNVGRLMATSVNKGLMEATNGGQLIMGSLTLLNVGGTIQAVGAKSYVLLAGQGAGNETFSGGTWKTSSGGIIYSYDNGVLFDGTTNPITNAGTLQLIDGAAHPGGNFQGTVKNTRTIQLLSKGNQIVAGIPGGQTWTLTGGGSLTLGDGTNNSYNNQNGISGGTFVNQQLVQGSGFIFNPAGFNNSGTINADVPPGTNNLQLQVGRSGASTNTGTMEATNGGVLVVGSTTINNTGGTIEAVGANSYVALVGSLGEGGLTISGGTYTTSGGGAIYGYGGSLLDGTTNTISNTGTLVVPDNGQFPSYINVQGTLNNSGTIQLLPTSSGDLILIQVPSSETFTLTGSGKLTMGDGTNNSYNNNVSIGSDLGSSGNFVNQSTIEGTGSIGLVQGIVNQGTMNANVPVGPNSLELFGSRIGGVFLNNGTIEATNGGEFGFDPTFGLQGNFTNMGTLAVAAKSTINLVNTNDFTNLANGTLTGGTYNVAGTLQIPGNITTNDAKIALNGKASQILNPNTNALTGFLANASKGSFDLKGGQSFTSAGTFTNKGAISISKGSVFTVGAGGSYVQTGGKTAVNGRLTLSSTKDRTDDSDSAPGAAAIRIVKGSLFGNGGTIAAYVSSSGTVVPADSTTTVGKLKITGAYTQSGAGALDANIAGAKSGQFNVLSVTGTVNLGGTLNIKLLKKFVPLIGAEFEILTAPRVNGVFAKVNGAKINDSEHFSVSYNSNNVILTVVSGP